MSIAVALAALVCAQLLRWRARERWGLEAIVLCGATTFAVVGIVGSVLGALAIATPGVIAGVIGAIAVAWVPWRGATLNAQRSTLNAQRPTLNAQRSTLNALAPVLLVIVAAALRWPPHEAALAGRDQGTYVLRAEFTAREGAFSFIDPVLARAAEERAESSGPDDLLGLFPRSGERWREDVYESSYRPGWYLADRDRGLVVPQFLHAHPTILAIARMMAGASATALVVIVECVLGVLALLAIGRRLWGKGPWPVLAASAFAVAPLAIWVHRTPLGEALTGLLLAAAVLAVLRAREHGDRELLYAALLLGATAWVRGNAWITAPLVLAVLWLEPHGPRRHRAAVLLLAMLGGSIVLHAATSFPYLADELRRQLVAWREPSPLGLVTGAAIATLVWWSIDELVFGVRGRLAAASWLVRVRERLPLGIGVLAVLGLVAWLVRGAGASTPPFSRLDALVPTFGAAMLVPAALGLAIVVARWRLRTRDDVWLAAIAMLVAATVWLYAGRNLPRFGLYYYGRYLVPELLPVACLAGAHAIATIHRMLASRRWLAIVVTGGIAAAWLGAIALPLVRTPQTRLAEQRGSGRIVDAIAERVPPGAVIVAGGEGWHHGHTYNQVGGALAIGHGREVLPYLTREAAYASVHELLVDGPARRGEAPPPVFLLINEATHAVRGPDDPAPLAALDDRLPPPLRARGIVLLELVTDRLTPTEDALPTGVTRDVLRMALLELEVDPDAQVRRVHFGAAADAASQQEATLDELVVRVDGGFPAPEIVGATRSDMLCLHGDREVEIRIPPQLAAGTASVVLVATPASAATIESWQIDIDGAPRRNAPPRTSARLRDTLGPWPVAAPPRSIRVRGAVRPDRDAACPHGGIAELRLLGRDRTALDEVTPESIVLVPPQDLGHPVTAARWVPGRGLSRYRPSASASPELRALSLALRPGAPIELEPEPLPRTGPLDVVVNLTAVQLTAGARIRVVADEVSIGELAPPASRTTSWQSPPLRMRTEREVVRWRLELVDAGPDDVAWVRDIALFAR